MKQALEKWAKNGLKLSKMLTDKHKIHFAKRLRNLGIELLYGTGDLPVSLTYKKGDIPIKKGTELYKIMCNIDRETWSKSK